MLEELFERNQKHMNSFGEGHFEGLHGSQRPELVSVCCSDSRVSHAGMWSAEEAGWLFASSNIGNQSWDTVNGKKVVDGSLLYPIKHTDTRNVAVVGHTGCGAVTAAYDWVANDTVPQNDGIRELLSTLVPVVEEGLGADIVDKGDDEYVVNQLVEFSVRRQVEFLDESDEIPDDADVYGFVYDFQGAYGDVEGRTYLVSVNGDTDVGAPEGYEEFVGSLLSYS